jgi:hypothetical protein
MKKVIYTLVVVMFIFSCRSVEKMVSKGEYESAFAYGSEKLRDPKNHKRENIVAYERAYKVLKERDLETINFIMSTPHEHKWNDILSLYSRLNNRERLLASVLPLRTKDGYLSRISPEDYSAEIANARKEKVAYEYKLATNLLNRAKNGNPLDARKAYDLLSEVKKYDPFYGDTEILMDEAFHLGLEIVGIDFESSVGGITNDLITREIINLDPARWNSFWKKYEFVDKRNPTKNYHTYMVIKIDDVNFGMEREFVNNYDKVKTIVDGERVVFDKNGVALKDTAGHKITEPNTVEVRAIVTEARREKSSNLTGRLSIYNNLNELPVRSIPISVDYIFEDVAMRIVGDRRALDDIKLRKVDGVLVDFPDNISMVNVLSRSFYNEIEKIIKKLV